MTACVNQAGDEKAHRDKKLYANVNVQQRQAGILLPPTPKGRDSEIMLQAASAPLERLDFVSENTPHFDGVGTSALHEGRTREDGNGKTHKGSRQRRTGLKDVGARFTVR